METGSSSSDEIVEEERERRRGRELAEVLRGQDWANRRRWKSSEDDLERAEEGIPRRTLRRKE
jgi:hypothetical protein